MNYAILVPKKIRFVVWKVSFPVNFRFISGEIYAEKICEENFIAPKDSSLNFRGIICSYFWAIMLIAAGISILDSLLPARTVTVKILSLTF